MLRKKNSLQKKIVYREEQVLLHATYFTYSWQVDSLILGSILYIKPENITKEDSLVDIC